MAGMILRKRRARAGEIGLFVDHEIFAEDFATLKLDSEYAIEAKGTADTTKYVRFSWVIADKIVATGAFDHKDDARDAALIECRHYRRKFDKLRGKAELIPKPTSDLDQTEWIRLIRRLVHVATTVFGVPEEELNSEMPPMERTTR